MNRCGVVAGALLLASAVVVAQSSMTDPALSKIAADFGAAVSAGNAANAAAFYSADASFMPPNEPAVKGKANIQAWFQKQMDQGTLNLQLKPTESRISGDLAFEAGTFVFQMKPKTGQPMTDTGKYVVVLKKEGATWKMSHDIFNSDMPMHPPSSK